MKIRLPICNELKKTMGIQSPSDVKLIAPRGQQKLDDMVKNTMNSIYGYHGGLRNMPNIDEMSEMKETKKNNKQSEEEWIWIDGYKGTNKDMKCANDFQFELGKAYEVEGEVKECENGFHLCRTLDDVFQYYTPGEGTRYFKVQALVRKSDFEGYGKYDKNYFFTPTKKDKLVAKSIILTAEVDKEEIYATLRRYYNNRIDDSYSDKELDVLLQDGVDACSSQHRINILISDGYYKTFAEYVGKLEGMYEKAHALAYVEGLSVDVRTKLIFDNN